MILPGFAGTDNKVTANVWAVLLPQVPLAVTETLPPPVAGDAMMLSVEELPVHETGNVHV